MRVLGIDPGTWKTGVGMVVREKAGLRALHYETLEVQDVRNKVSLAKRLKRIHDGLQEIFKIYRPDVVALEDVFYSESFKTAIRIGEARAVAILTATDFGVEVVEYPPARVKQAVSGNGVAVKTQMQFMVRHLLKLRTNPEPDSADALALAICHFQHLDGKLQAKMDAKPDASKKTLWTNGRISSKKFKDLIPKNV